MDKIELLKQKLNTIEADLEEARRRLPAHSVKPALMAAVFDLEDEREAVLREIDHYQSKIKDRHP